MGIMNKKFFVIAAIVYISNYIITEIFNINTNNTLWSVGSCMALFIPLCIGCIINSIIYNKKDSPLRFLFYYFSFMCSLGILLIAILSSFILKNINQCLIIIMVFMLLSILSVMGYLISKKYNYKYKKVFAYFSALFLLSLLIDLILTIIQIFR